MARELLLDLLLAAAAKPHSKCMNSFAHLPRHCVRLASTSTRTPPSRTPPPSSPSSSSSAPKVPSAAKIPLHVGLDRNPDNLSAISKIPIPRGVRGENFVPSVLARPLGLQYPPRPGQNLPTDHRSFSERKRDFQDYDKVQEKRKVYLRSFFRPYFQEWKRFNHHKGKSFVANERLIRRDKALYFPNIWGQTLAEDDGPDGGRDTTNVLMGKVSIVSMFSNQWAEEQVKSYVGQTANPELDGLLRQAGERAQRVNINIQGDWARLLLVKLFKNGLRKQIAQEDWQKYFMVKLPRDIRRGLTDEIRDAMGLLNPSVGYVYLLDTDCRIRWAGSADAWEGEIASLNSGFQRLLQEASSSPTTNSKSAQPVAAIAHAQSAA